jgi:tetrahydromethanopterin S-methyltransferase subunit A
LRAAVAAPKCHSCGCFQDALEALQRSSAVVEELGPELEAARGVVEAKQYDCLGCRECHPAVLTNALAASHPEVADLALCPTDIPLARRGWPPLPGDYHVLRYRAPVALCTLGSDRLADDLARAAPDGLAIVGTLRTENLGIERIIQNVLANPNIRFFVLAGPDGEASVGHLAGQSFVSLFENGLDEQNRIRGARGKRPKLVNVSREQVEAFLRQVEPVVLVGEERDEVVRACVDECARRDPGPLPSSPTLPAAEVVAARPPRRLIPDPAGYFVIYPDGARQLLVLEHYDVQGVLDCVIEGRVPADLSGTAIERGLLSRLDHAAYLGAELARAEQCLKTGLRYVQDRAPGEIESKAEAPKCGCKSGCC